MRVHFAIATLLTAVLAGCAFGEVVSHHRTPSVHLDVAAAPAAPVQAAPATTVPIPPTTRRTAPTTRTTQSTIVLTGPLGDLPTDSRTPVIITGRVVTASGAPVPNACVTVDSPANVPAVRTGADGRFAVAYMSRTSSQTASVTVRDCTGAVPGFPPQQLTLAATPAQPADVPVVVHPGR